METQPAQPVFLPFVKKECEKITDSQYFQCVEKDNIRIVLLSIYHLKKVLHDQNLLLAINMTKVENEQMQNLCEILHDNVCIKNTEQNFQNFVSQFDLSIDYLTKNSLLIPYDVLVNDLSKYTVDNVWAQSISSLATTEYIFSLIFAKLNKFATNDKIKLNENNDASINLLKMLNSQQIYTTEIETGIIETVKAFCMAFDVLCEIFFNEYK